jgi:sarcosine oxidase
VIGAGVIGLATTAALLELDAEVTCYERLAPMAERSCGESRIFRYAHRNAELVELAGQSRRLYGRWEQQAGEQLIDPVGTVISGPTVEAWSGAMSQAGAPYELVEAGSQLLRLPTQKVPAENLIDPAGGVLRVDRIGAFLSSRCGSAIRHEHVFGLDEGAEGVTVHASGSRETYDVVVICAGAGTAPLAVQIGLYPPIALTHHARFTFRTRPQAVPRMQCWITLGEDGVSSYQHANAPGQWAVGPHLQPDEVRWDVGRETATNAAREIARSYVQNNLEAIDPAVIAEIYCTTNPDLDDGVVFLRSGRTLAVYGENLFKFAPLIGQRLAEAALRDTLPDPMGSP